MTEFDDGGDLLSYAVQAASGILDTGRRTWLLGAAHLTEQPLDSTLDAELVRQVIDLATRTTQFPSGPLDFIPKGFQQEINVDHRIVTLSSEAAPHLQLKIGFGDAGILAIGLTRTDVLDDGTRHPGAVVLSDLESVAADAVIIAVGSAMALGYWGPIDFYLTVRDDRPGQDLTLFGIDDETAILETMRTGVEQFDPVRRRLVFHPDCGARDVHQFLYGLVREASRQFGTSPQLVTGLFDANHPEYTNRPLQEPATPEAVG